MFARESEGGFAAAEPHEGSFDFRISMVGAQGTLPVVASITRLVGAILLEQDGEWQLRHRDMTLEILPCRTDESRRP